MSDLRSYHTDQIVSEEPVWKHKPYCHLKSAHRKFDCGCPPVRGTRIVIEVWDDYVVNVKPKVPSEEDFQKALKKIQDDPEMKKIKQEISDATRLTAEDLNFRINARDDVKPEEK